MFNGGDIAVTLSGGGVRAMIFHAGVLLYLAEQGEMENVKYISTVSGGSLLTGLIYAKNDYKWPDSRNYIDRIYPNIKKILTNIDLQKSSILALLKPSNWDKLFSRANILAKAMEDKWGVKKAFGDIDKAVTWTINGTTAENSRRFRIKNDTFGDYELGYADAKKFKLSEAMAISAAFPGLIGPLTLDPKSYKWFKKSEWDSDEEKKTEIPYKKLNIYDGGVYDNLGTEPFFDISTGKMKMEKCRLLVSDAGSRFTKGDGGFSLLRILNITMEQTRALRVRSLMSFLSNNTKAGAYLMMGKHPLEILGKTNGNEWQSPEDVKHASEYETTLKKVKDIDFDRISTHGYELAKAVDIKYFA